MRGTTLKARSGRRFVVQVNFIQRGAAVELPDYQLVAVNPAAQPG
jgi:hypothetical protein